MMTGIRTANTNKQAKQTNMCRRLLSISSTTYIQQSLKQSASRNFLVSFSSNILLLYYYYYACSGADDFVCWFVFVRVTAASTDAQRKDVRHRGRYYLFFRFKICIIVSRRRWLL